MGGPANTGVKVTATLHNHRSDATIYHGFNQELPAVYSNGEYYRLITSKNGQIQELDSGWDPTPGHFPWIPGAFTADENWAALVDKDGFGMGIVNTNTTSFVGGFSGGNDKKGSGGSYDPQTGYIAPVKNLVLPPNGVYMYEFYLVLGDIETIRAYAKQIKSETMISL